MHIKLQIRLIGKLYFNYFLKPDFRRDCDSLMTRIGITSGVCRKCRRCCHFFIAWLDDEQAELTSDYSAMVNATASRMLEMVKVS
ncbi:hypothetical protein [Methylotenera sp. G11]|uniref:hypothetical protein n=1 Tax=Methylotenera sp. G11 TaxID=1506585 RepID=UPI0006470CE2|nr:hypothetical protein [Methylotenera sp. G11]